MPHRPRQRRAHRHSIHPHSLARQVGGRENALEIRADAPACAPNRRPRFSAGMGRNTCLSAEEESRLVSGPVDGDSRGGESGRPSASDRELARKAGLADVVRPPMPSEWRTKPRKWLSNLDIDRVMTQYARLVPNFEYLGTVPSDFAGSTKTGTCVAMCSPCKLRRVFRRGALGASIVNLDVHTGPGTHWVALILDARVRSAPRFHYYDPTGKPPPEGWLTDGWHVLLAAAPHEKGRRALVETADYNHVSHQRGNTECGIFSMMVVDAMIAGVAFDTYCERAIDDDYAFKHRRVFFEAGPEFAEVPRGGSGWTWWNLIESIRGSADR